MRWRAGLWTVTLWMSACTATPTPEPTPDRSDAETAFEPVTAVYRCRSAGGDVVLVTRSREQGLHVFLPPGVEGGHLDCDHDRRASIWEHAKLNGVDFRAVGHEPGWVLEIREGQRLDLGYDYGQSQLSAQITGTRTDPTTRTTTYSGAADGHIMVVRLTGEDCSDSMSEEAFPTRVEIEVDGRTFSGCGRPLH